MGRGPRRRATEALMAAARGAIGRFRDLDAEAWALLPAVAEAHGLASLGPLVAAARAAPDDIVEAFADLEARTRARYRRLEADRSAMASALEAAGVPYAFLKGAWLAEQGLATDLRPSADIDVYAPAEFRRGVDRATAALGYRLATRTARHRVYARPGNTAVVDLRGEHPDNPRPVEVHPRVAEAFRGIRLDLTDRVARGRPLSLAQGGAHIAAHATADALGRKLRAVALLDLTAVTREMDAHDWAEFEALTVTRHAARFVWPALELATIHAMAPIPLPVRSSLRRHVRPGLASWLGTLDVDSASRLGRRDTPRSLGEVPRIWPLDRRESVTVWRAILWPGRWELADRYPREAASSLWPVMYGRHAAYNATLLARRLRVRH